MSLLDELREAPDLYDTPDDEAREAWRIDGLGRATWAMRKLRDIEAQRAEIRRVVEAEVDRLNQWAVTADAPLARDASFFEGVLSLYALQVRADSPKDKRGEPTVKSITTPYGVVQTRESGGGWKATDEALEWARKAHPELVETIPATERFKVAAAKVALDVTPVGVVDPDTGDLVPGITVEPKVVKATVKLLDDGAGA